MSAAATTPGAPDRPVGDQGLASIRLSLQWADRLALHTDEWHVERFSAWRERDLLPGPIAAAIPDMRRGDNCGAQTGDGELAGPHALTRVAGASVSAFDRQHLRGLTLEPRLGRFYPQGFFSRIGWAFHDGILPARITALDGDHMQVDFNRPLAGCAVDLDFEVLDVLPGYDRRGGRCNDPLHELLRHPGMAAALTNGSRTDYGDHGRGMSRMDDREDALFYRSPRLVQHLDNTALATVNRIYRRLIPRDARVLDLMGSHDSHLDGVAPRYLEVLGMNWEELGANGSAHDRTLCDLNTDPVLGNPDGSLDAVVCTASVEYLTAPGKVLAEVQRALRPGGIFILTFSNRWFPGKAVNIWSELHEFERLGMVTQWLDQAGFSRLHTLSSRGASRPHDDPHAHETALSDPVYAAWGYRPPGK